jgi:hypothetical protein
MGNVKAISDQEPRMAGMSYFNCDPCSGEWEIEFISANDGSEAKASIGDVWLNIALATLPSAR